MATNRVWLVKYVAGNPKHFSRVTTAAGGPFLRSHALSSAQHVADNGGGWRVWVEHQGTGKRIFESPAEIEHQATLVAK